MRFRDINAGEQSAELELAPMIDVVFQLLIFFIVTWQFARFERDMDISVPSAEQAENKDRQAGESSSTYERTAPSSSTGSSSPRKSSSPS